MPAKEWKRFEGDDTYVKFTNLGDYVEGVINEIKFETKFGKDQPVLYLRCEAIDEETGKKYQKQRILTVGQTQLQRLLAQDPPEEGDGIRITFVEEKGGQMGNPTKIFEVKITPRAMLNRQPMEGDKMNRPAPEPDFMDEPF
jgi:hypothetical protein